MKTTVKTTAINTNGRILHEDDKRVVIATALKTSSTNTKTGGMVQIYILVKDQSPLKALKTGRDADICGTCIHRPKRVKVQVKTSRTERAKNAKRTLKTITKTIRRCYVQVGKAPQGIWRCYKRGGYAIANPSEYPALFGGRLIRWGAYGDPAFIPAEIIAAITAVSGKRTGYTHQWEDAAYGHLKGLMMASADNEAHALKAVAEGWRYFRVRHVSQAPLPNEIVCPAAKEAGHKTTCDKCGLCNGKAYGSADPRKNIVIIDHSVIANTQPLIQISGLGLAA